MGNPRAALPWLCLAVTGLLAPAATPPAAAGNVCPGAPTACQTQIQAAGTVVNDIFRDANGRTGPELNTGKLFNRWAGCAQELGASCAGLSTAPYDCPSRYACEAGVPSTFVEASRRVNSLDHTWWQSNRLANPTLVAGCPQWAAIADGVGGNYLPQFGLIFDLGGEANKAVVFAENDHGPQPCESLEYSVFLTDNPMATEVVLDPATTGIDPMKWNRAVLSKIYTHGWVDQRAADPTGHAACGDTAQYPVEDDSFVQVFSLPCGANFRYASIVSGNDGLDFPACGFDSSEDELDAVIGLTEAGAGICPDADRDHFPDCACAGAPAACDCNDADPAVHPGAHEACDSPDLDCDGRPGACPMDGSVCYAHQCVQPCGTSEFPCTGQLGTTCQATPQGRLCVPLDCSAVTCPVGSSCVNGSCAPDCTGVVCPAGQACAAGVCADPCAGVVCPAGRTCVDGACALSCSCFAGDVGCAGQAGTVCQAAAGTCGFPACAAVSCPAGEHCDMSGQCVAQCAGVVCPALQRCVEGAGCQPLCAGVTCAAGQACEPTTGGCVDAACVGVPCPAPFVCVAGGCVDPNQPDAGAPADAGPGGGAGGDAGAPAGKAGGCCDAGGGAAAGSVLLAALVGALGRRRRRRPA